MSSPPSQLFLARVWKEPSDQRRNTFRVQIRHILSGETRYFSRWRDVARFVMERLEEENPGTEPPGEEKRERTTEE